MANLKGTSVSGALSISGLITASSADSHKGIKIGNTYITAIDGSIIFQNNGAPTYLVGIEGFANGGTLKWQNVDNINVGYASSAGWATSAGRVRTQSNNDWWLDMRWDGTYFITRAISDGGSYLPIWVNNADYANSAGDISTSNTTILSHKGGANDFDRSAGIRIGTITGGTGNTFGSGWGSYLQMTNNTSSNVYPGDNRSDNWYWQLAGTTDEHLYTRFRTNGGSWSSVKQIAFCAYSSGTLTIS